MFDASATPAEEKNNNKKSPWSDLTVRVMSGVVLAVLAFAVTWWGGIAFALFFGVVAILVFWEWVRIVGERALGTPAIIGYGCLLGSMISLWFGAWQAGLVLPVLGAAFLSLVRCSYPAARWTALGILYASSFGFAILALRLDSDFGFAAILVLFALVWGTDVAAYFTGKIVKGPKLWTRVSPKKTWSGSIGGLVLGTGFALLVAFLLKIEPTLKLVVMLGGLSVLSQLGDLAESQIKRIFKVKDSSSLIPGHGGVMDRVDGLLFAVVAACMIGLASGSIHSVATGFLIW
ncbi:phosphatidate cytidylyltransferase [uncultured Cohaesibacter sp.]|uniref:phosphatidate cytidylyltransferase n=1 Tax=uncultured Cohaesibacter sp. TaxID=1002546 RepID=UPI002930F1CE|nr:phosphatidate cytidylyltransferase [uncultured Cohaesibacter sp.]